MAFDRVVISCEHGGNRIPARYQAFFAGHGQTLLATHRGWDLGALQVARWLSKELSAPLFAATVSRLLIDLNRSWRHPKIFSEFTSDLSQDEKDVIRSRYYDPHRNAVQAQIAAWTKHNERVLHLGVHSFTPILNRQVRRAELGLLYDPQRRSEAKLARALQQNLRTLAPRWRTRRNYPYTGVADGFTSHLRKVFTTNLYAGLELEINQDLLSKPADVRSVQRLILQALRATQVLNQP